MKSTALQNSNLSSRQNVLSNSEVYERLKNNILYIWGCAGAGKTIALKSFAVQAVQKGEQVIILTFLRKKSPIFYKWEMNFA